jgi:hypothetical protein
MASVDEGVAGPAPPGHPNSVDGSLSGQIDLARCVMCGVGAETG